MPGKSTESAQLSSQDVKQYTRSNKFDNNVILSRVESLETESMVGDLLVCVTGNVNKKGLAT